MKTKCWVIFKNRTTKPFANIEGAKKWLEKNDVEPLVITEPLEEETININDIVEVKLTEHGKVLLGRYGEKYEEIRTSNETLRVSLWELMNIFGNHMRMGANQIFVGNKIKLKGGQQ